MSVCRPLVSKYLSLSFMHLVESGQQQVSRDDFEIIGGDQRKRIWKRNGETLVMAYGQRGRIPPFKFDLPILIARLFRNFVHSPLFYSNPSYIATFKLVKKTALTILTLS